MSAAQTELIIQGRHRDPFSYLGPHKGQIRAWLPQAINASVLVGDQVIVMKRSHPAGFFIAKTEASDYRFRITLPSGQWQELDDPYRFPALLTPFELHLHGEAPTTKVITPSGRTRLPARAWRAFVSRCGLRTR